MDLHRRNLLVATGALATLAATRSQAAGLMAWPMGVQLWTVDAQLRQDIPGTLRRLKSLGIEVVETAGLYGGAAQALRAQLDAAGLACRSCHVNLGQLGDDLDRQIADARTLGARWLVASSPKTPRPLDPKKPWGEAMTEVMDEAAWRMNAGIVAAITPKIAAAGMTFAYHNHAMEFARFAGGRTGLDILMSGHPQAKLELDLGWVAAAGREPAATIKAYASRVELLHLKDMVRATPEWRSVEIGRGVIAWAPALLAAKAAGVKAAFIEQEAPFQRPIFDSLAMSIRQLRTI